MNNAAVQTKHKTHEGANSLILDMKNIDKRFTGVHALRNVNFNLHTGEILGLVGENGAGKSTLMKILTGIYTKDRGEIYYRGELFDPHNPRYTIDRGISIIHQELSLMEDLTVAENVLIGREPLQKNKIFLNNRRQITQTQELFDRLNIHLDPQQPLSELTVGKQQMVEIARAVSTDIRLLILDEPSAALSKREADDLFKIMKDMKDQGVSMIYISHRLEEIHQITDRVTVLRDGELIDTRPVSDVSRQDIIGMMVGRTIYESHQEDDQSQVIEKGPVVLSVKNVNAGRRVQNISFDLHEGEILGFAGLIGAGRTETARAIFGADPLQSGEIAVDGKPVTINSPTEAVSLGIGYLSEDRKRYGLAVGLNLCDNIMLASYSLVGKGPMISNSEIVEVSRKYIDKLRIKTPDIKQLVRNLSGGNQQKVVLAKWLLRNSKILIFDEPTRGIDVGAKSEIYHLMNELTDMGKSIIMISSELPEILRMSDRIAVMSNGKITGILGIEDADQESIMDLATSE